MLKDLMGTQKAIREVFAEAAKIKLRQEELLKILKEQSLNIDHETYLAYDQADDGLVDDLTDEIVDAASYLGYESTVYRGNFTFWKPSTC